MAGVDEGENRVGSAGQEDAHEACDCASGCSIDGPLSVAVARIMVQLRLNPTVQ